MKNNNKQTELITIDSIKQIRGYKVTIKQPSIFVVLQVNKLKNIQKNLKRYDANIQLIVNGYQCHSKKNKPIDIINRILVVQRAVVGQVKLPIFYNNFIAFNNNKVFVSIPTAGDELYLQIKLFKLLVGVLNGIEIIDVKKNIDDISKAMIQYAPKGVNQKVFLKLANESEMVYKQISRDIYQFGYGKNSRYLDSTTTDKTSEISAKLACNKLITKKLLKQTGLPALDSYILNSSNEAVNIANNIGYPLVIKPTDKDGGKGVTSWILNKELLNKAYIKAKKISNNIVIEKHVELNEYRFDIYAGEIINGYERIAANVVGDGKQTIKQLINEVNLKRKIQQQENKYTKLIHINEETKQILSDQSLFFDSIPKDNEFVRLSRTNSVKEGGSRVNIEDFSKIHQDILTVLKRVGEVFRIDIYGVDIFIGDISKPFSQTQIIINEVNFKPRIRELQNLKCLFNKLVPNNGEVPSVVVVGAHDANIVSYLIKIAKQNNKKIAIISREGIYKNDQLLTNLKYNNLYDSSQVVMNDLTIDAIMLFVEDAQQLSQGYPLKHSDLVVVTDSSIPNFSLIVKEIINYFNTTTLIDKALSHLEVLQPLLVKANINEYLKTSIVKKIKNKLGL